MVEFFVSRLPQIVVFSVHTFFMNYTFLVITPGEEKRYTTIVERNPPVREYNVPYGTAKGGILVKRQKSVLVCVTGQKDSERLIREGEKEARQLGVSLQVLCVQPVPSFQTKEEQQIFQQVCGELENLRQIAKEAGAEMTVYFYNDPALAAAGFAKHVGAIQVITGVAEAPVRGFVDIFHQLLPKLPISMVSRDGIVYHLCPQEHTVQVPQMPRCYVGA